MFCKSCEQETVLVLIFALAEQFHIHKSYKTRESTLSGIGNFEGNMDLSGIHLAVPPDFSDLPTALKRRGRGYYVDTIVSPLQTALYSVIEKKKD